jgi:hypothetical protein
VAALGVVTVWVLVAGHRMSQWGTMKTVVFTIPFLVALALVLLAWRVMRSKDNIRKNWVANNPDDPQCRNHLVVYDLSRKALYIPTIATSLVMCALMYCKDHWGWLPDLQANLLGGIWLGVFFLNFLVEEYDVDLRCIIITVIAVAATFMWVTVLDWVPEFLRLFKNFAIEINAAGYLLIAAVFVTAILYSVAKGAFHYVEITPNFINIQTGLAETGEQLSREQFSTRVEAEDLIERMFGFGRLVITFRDTRRPPLTLLVHGLGKKAAQLEAIRSTYLVDSQDTSRGA